MDARMARFIIISVIVFATITIIANAIVLNNAITKATAIARVTDVPLKPVSMNEGKTVQIIPAPHTYAAAANTVDNTLFLHSAQTTEYATLMLNAINQVVVSTGNGTIDYDATDPLDFEGGDPNVIEPFTIVFDSRLTPPKISELLDKIKLTVGADGLDYPTEEDGWVEADAEGSPALLESIPLIHANEVQASGNTGSGSEVCIADTGIQYPLHPSLPVPVYTYDAVNKKAGLSNVNDTDGHGTKLAGIVASLDSTYKGVAPQANILIFKVDNVKSNGKTTLKYLKRALNKCFKYKDEQGNTPLIFVTGFVFKDQLYNSPSEASFKGIYKKLKKYKNKAVIAPVGNHISAAQGLGTSGITALLDTSKGVDVLGVAASYDKAGNFSQTYSHTNSVGITFSCTDTAPFPEKYLACMSNCGLFTDYVLPGMNIKTTTTGNGFAEVSGTSAAAAHLAGVIALMQAKNPSISLPEIRSALSNTAEKPVEGYYVPQFGSYCYGQGFVNAKAAVDAVPA
ncbi:MAG: S8 family serine peptidase [Candidatus Diapherotrites archaeon]|nr:S8 family serine peptidase [Candidatus Diapherotrites archaeon]